VDQPPFDRFRDSYVRGLTSTLKYRPAVLMVWAIVVLLISFL